LTVAMTSNSPVTPATLNAWPITICSTGRAK
jgi:hypothetical protein